MGKLMKKIVIQSVPFCYGPTSIAIAIGRLLKNEPDCAITALGKNPSLELLNAERDMFSHVIDMDVAEGVLSALSSADLIITVCDFDFAKMCKADFSEKPLVFIDPLLWMWESLPDIIGRCDLYLALEFPGVSETVYRACSESILMIPQVAEFTAIRDQDKVQRGRVLVNLGGMLSPLGANFSLALAMCEEIINVFEENKSLVAVDIRTSHAMAIKLQEMLPKVSNVNIASLSIRAFQSELAKCEILLTVPGMSIVYESFIAQVPSAFILPLNYSQHLQISQYRKIFPTLSEIRWNIFDSFYELPSGMEEPEGVRLAREMGEAFSIDASERAKFRKLLEGLLDNKNKIPSLQACCELDVSGATKVMDILHNRNLI